MIGCFIKSLLFFGSCLFVSVVFAETTNNLDCTERQFPGVTAPSGLSGKKSSSAPVDEKPCSATPDLINALRAEITRSVCIDNLDPVCMYNYNKNSADFPCIAESRQGKSRNSLADCLMQKGRVQNLQDTHSAKIFAAWQSGDKKFRINMDRWSELESVSTESVTEVFGAAATLGSGLWGKVAQTGYQIVNLLFSDFPPKSTGFEMTPTNECDWSTYFIPAVISPAGCHAHYSVETPTVKDFLNQSDKFVAEKLKCGATCQFYKNLLSQVYMANVFKLRRSVTDMNFSCNSTPAGAKTSFTFNTASPGLGSSFGVDSLPPREWKVSSRINDAATQIDLQADRPDLTEHDTSLSYSLRFRQNPNRYDYLQNLKNSNKSSEYEKRKYARTPIYSLYTPIATLNNNSEVLQYDLMHPSRKPQQMAVMGASIGQSCCDKFQNQPSKFASCFENLLSINVNRKREAMESSPRTVQ